MGHPKKVLPVLVAFQPGASPRTDLVARRLGHRTCAALRADLASLRAVVGDDVGNPLAEGFETIDAAFAGRLDAAEPHLRQRGSRVHLTRIRAGLEILRGRVPKLTALDLDFEGIDLVDDMLTGPT